MRLTERCKACPLRSQLRHAVPFELEGEADYLLVGEAPGKEEIRVGRPFVGPAGRLLRKVLEPFGIPYHLANTVQCPPQDGEKIRTPTDAELFHCGYHVRHLLKNRPYRRVVLLGAVAAKNFGLQGSVTELVNGSPYRIEPFEGIEFYVFYHPSYILRQTKGKEDHPLYQEYQHAWAKLFGFQSPNFSEAEKLNYRVYSWDQYLEAFRLFEGVDLALDFETVGSEVSEDRKILGVGLGTEDLQIYLDLTQAPHHQLVPIFRELSDLLDRNREMGKRILVYNQTFESGVFLQVLKDRIRFFDDVWTMAKSLGYYGSLKDLAQRLLGAPSWSEEIQEIVGWIQKLVSYESKKPGALRNHLEGKKTYKQLEKILEERPASVPEDVLERYLPLLESGEEMLGWSLVPLDVMALYNARDTYWTYRLWKFFQPQLAPIFEEVYQEQENLSTVMQLARLRISSEAYHQLKTNFQRSYVEALIRFIRHPVAWDSILDFHLKKTPIRKLEVAAPWVVTLKTVRPELHYFTQFSLEELESQASEEEKAKELLQLISAKIPSWKDELAQKLESLLEEYPVHAHSWESLQSYSSRLEEWYNPNSTKIGLEIFNRVMSEPNIQLALFFRAVVKAFGDAEVSQLVERFGPFNQWPEKAESILEFLGQPRYRSELQEAKKYLEELKDSFDIAYLNEIYSALNQFYGFHSDRPETYPKEEGFASAIRAYLDLRIAKKSLKLISTYLDGRTGMKGAFKAGTTEIRGIPIPIGSQKAQDYWAETDFIAIGAETRRWRSPFHTLPSGNEVRELYISRWGSEGIFLHYDYAQMEVRVLAALAQEKILLEKLLEDVDVHYLTASLIFNIPPEEVEDYQRRYAKTATFAILYGKSLHAFAMEYTSGSLEQAQKIFDAYFKAFPGIRSWIDRMHAMADEIGKVPTIFHPQDLIDVQIYEPGYHRRAQNYPVQSSASSLAGIGGMRIFRLAQERGIRLIPVIFTHDAMDFEVHLEDLWEAISLVREVSVGWIRQKYGVPVNIDFEVGTTAFGGVELSREGGAWKFSGPKRYVDPFLEALEAFYEVEILSESFGQERVHLETILVGRATFSQFAGQEIPTRTLVARIHPRRTAWSNRSTSLPAR